MSVVYTVYQTTCLVNGKTYIGVHKTSDPNDRYLGSGVLFSKAVAKYGKENFKKEVLFVFDNPKEMLAKEAELVVVDPETTYNLDRGGLPGFGAIPISRLKEISRKGIAARQQKIQEDPDFKARMREVTLRAGEIGRSVLSILYETDPSWTTQKIEANRVSQKLAVEAATSPEARAKRIQTLAHIEHQKGSTNSQSGTCWVNLNGVPKRIPKEDLEEHLGRGFSKGRGNDFKNNMSTVVSLSPSRPALGTVWMNRDGKSRHVQKSEIESYLNLGWVLGRSKALLS